MRRAILVCLLLAGCGGDAGEPSPSPRVTGKVDLERPRAGAPDAGTVAGHGADGGVGTTSAAAFAFTGRVSPPGSTVRVSEGDVRVEPSGRFTVAVLSPRSGTKQVRIEATKAGHRPWRVDVRVVRGTPQRVRVPERDDTAPTAALVIDRGDGRPVVLASPSRQGERAELLVRGARSFTATGVARDAGGTGRIRVSFTKAGRCGGKAFRAQAYLPPAQVQSIALPPGASAPVERERTVRVPIAARGERCRVGGEVWAEATDAHGRQAVTRHAGYRYP